MRILIAADGSKHGTGDLLSACRILSPNKHEFDLLTVALRTPGVQSKQAQGVQNRFNRRTNRIAEAEQKKLAADGVNANVIVKTGSPAWVR